MTRLTFSPALLVLVIAGLGPSQMGKLASAAEVKSKVISADVFARRVIAITDLVLQHEIYPPTRQEMILEGTKSLLKKSGQPVPERIVAQEMFVEGIKSLFKESGQPIPAAIARMISASEQADDLNRSLKKLWSSVEGVRSSSAAELQAAMFRGLLGSVPGKPQIIPPKAFKIVKQTKSNRYVGIGIELVIDRTDRLATIRTPFLGGPAHDAGAKAGDRILEVDGKSTKGLSLGQAVALLRGEEGTRVTILVRQPDDAKPRKLTMTRRVVPFQSVLGYRRAASGNWDFRVRRSDPIAYLAIPTVRVSTVHELRKTAPILEADGLPADLGRLLVQRSGE